jgi:Flp pilus assembly protein TadD
VPAWRLVKPETFSHMKYFLFIIVSVLAGSTAYSQTATQLRDQARTLLQQGDFEKAIATLKQAKQTYPSDKEVLKDLTYASYLNRDFGAAIETGKQLVERPDADPQSFQMLGMAYKSIAATREATRLYKTALQKFPNSGVIYNEYGELFAMDQHLDDAAEQWEKGIEADPNYSSNYYNAAMYYNRAQNWLKTILYGETFMNLESFTKRTENMKPVLLEAYKKILIPGTISNLQQARNVSEFEKNVLSSYNQAAATVKDGGSVESISAFRKQFITDWSKMKQTRYPSRLFEHQQQLQAEGLSDAYSNWLLTSSDEYQSWQSAHPRESAAFKKWQENKVFKIPAGQHY